MSQQWGVTGPEFACMVLIGHTRVAHVNKQSCAGSDCASLRLLRDHPDNWETMSAQDYLDWMNEGRG